MTAELGPAARALLDAARAELTPDAAAIARVRGKLAGAVAGGATAAGIAGKLVVLVVVAAVSAATVYTIGSIVRGRSAAGGRAARPAAIAAVAARADTSRITVAVPPRDPAPRVGASREVARPVADRAAPRRPATLAPTIATLGREVELIDAAMAALRRGDPRAALVAVHRHAAETRGRGQLAEDAAAIEIEALCALRDPAATHKLATFDARWPASAQRARLSTSCP